MQLPSMSYTRLFPDALFTVLANTELEQGFVHAVAADRELFLFLRDGRAWCAGAREGGTLGAISVSEFVRAVRSSHEFREVTLHRTDLPLFLCAGVLFRKPPAAHVPAALVDGEALLKSVRALGKDAVLAVQRSTPAGDAWALAFCRSGEPAALYAAPELGVPAEGSVNDRLMELVYAAPNEATIDLYDEIRLPPAADAGQLITSLAAPLPHEASTATLVVLLGDRVVYRHRVDKPETIVGRGEEADLALDNLSVSRRHARIRVVGDELVVEDLGSENGLTQFGACANGPVTLRPGDRIGIGKYDLSYATHVVGAEASPPSVEPAPRKRAATADMDTVAVRGKSAVLEHRGRRHRVASVVFTIGSSPEAHLRIRGLFVAPVQALLQVDGDGYRVDDQGSLRKVRVNGAITKQAALVDGDMLQIAGETMRFRYL